MARATDVVLLVSVLALLVLVLGVAESGAGPGTYASYIPPSTTSRSVQTNQSAALNSTTTVKSTTANQTIKTTSTKISGSNTTAASGTITVAPWSSLEVVAWYILFPVVTCLAAGMVVMLIRKEKPRIFDLKEVVKEMESQRDYFASTWSKKLRNAALLRYYVLMAQACAKVGIEDRPADTPHEFIGRASTELKVEASDAARFADAIDRAHYGAELSGEEVASASRFMDSFTKVIVRRAALG